MYYYVATKNFVFLLSVGTVRVVAPYRQAAYVYLERRLDYGIRFNRLSVHRYCIDTA